MVWSIVTVSNQMPTKVITVQTIQNKQHQSVQGILEYLHV